MDDNVTPWIVTLALVAQVLGAVVCSVALGSLIAWEAGALLAGAMTALWGYTVSASWEDERL